MSGACDDDKKEAQQNEIAASSVIKIQMKVIKITLMAIFC